MDRLRYQVPQAQQIQAFDPPHTVPIRKHYDLIGTNPRINLDFRNDRAAGKHHQFWNRFALLSGKGFSPQLIDELKMHFTAARDKSSVEALGRRRLAGLVSPGVDD